MLKHFMWTIVWAIATGLNTLTLSVGIRESNILLTVFGGFLVFYCLSLASYHIKSLNRLFILEKENENVENENS